MKTNFLNVDNIEIWKRSYLTPKMVKNLKILVVSRKKVFVPEMKLKIFDVKPTLPLKIQQKEFFRLSENSNFRNFGPPAKILKIKSSKYL